MLTYQPGCPDVADVPDSVPYGGLLRNIVVTIITTSYEG